MIDQIKQRIKAALGRFAQRKAAQQAEGMKNEAEGIVAGAKDLARRNPSGFALLVVLGIGLVLLRLRTRQTIKSL